MAITDALLPEFDHEMATTRRLLDRVPEERFAWKPHDRSMSLGGLGTHLATIPGWSAALLNQSSFDLAESPPNSPALLDEFDNKVTAARARLARTTDPELVAPWTLKKGDQEFFTMPRIAAIRSFVMNHSIHHRGQLSVYLRLNDVPIPPIYGPTADEQF